MDSKKLYVFDFDNTLIKTTAKINVICPNLGHVIRSLSSEEFNTYQNEENHILDFNEFECPEILGKEAAHEKVFAMLVRKYNEGKDIAIVTARGSAKLIENFLLDSGISIEKNMIIAINEKGFRHSGSIKERKRKSLEDLIKMGYSNIEFIDDSMDNLLEVYELTDIYRIELKITHVENGKPKTVRKFQGRKI